MTWLYFVSICDVYPWTQRYSLKPSLPRSCWPRTGKWSGPFTLAEFWNLHLLSRGMFSTWHSPLNRSKFQIAIIIIRFCGCLLVHWRWVNNYFVLCNVWLLLERRRNRSAFVFSSLTGSLIQRFYKSKYKSRHQDTHSVVRRNHS